MEEYNNVIIILNDEAMKYLNTDYASDARCVGSVPNDKNSETKTYIYKSSFFGRDLKDADENYVLDSKQMNELGIEYTETEKEGEYWLASRDNQNSARTNSSNNTYSP